METWKDSNICSFNEETEASFEVINKVVLEWQEFDKLNQKESKESKKETRDTQQMTRGRGRTK